MLPTLLLLSTASIKCIINITIMFITVYAVWAESKKKRRIILILASAVFIIVSYLVDNQSDFDFKEAIRRNDSLQNVIAAQTDTIKANQRLQYGSFMNKFKDQIGTLGVVTTNLSNLKDKASTLNQAMQSEVVIQQQTNFKTSQLYNVNRKSDSIRISNEKNNLKQTFTEIQSSFNPFLFQGYLFNLDSVEKNHIMEDLVEKNISLLNSINNNSILNGDSILLNRWNFFYTSLKTIQWDLTGYNNNKPVDDVRTELYGATVGFFGAFETRLGEIIHQ